MCSYGDDFDELITVEDVRFITHDGITVSEDELYGKLLKQYWSHYGYMDYHDVAEWILDNHDAVLDCFYELDNAEYKRHRGYIPFGLRNSGLIDTADELYVWHEDKLAKFNDVYDELELIWEEASGHHVDDDGGFEFEQWCRDNPDTVLNVVSRKHCCEQSELNAGMGR